MSPPRPQHQLPTVPCTAAHHIPLSSLSWATLTLLKPVAWEDVTPPWGGRPLPSPLPIAQQAWVAR